MKQAVKEPKLGQQLNIFFGITSYIFFVTKIIMIPMKC